MTALEPQLYLAKVLDLNGPSTHDISNLQQGDISILRLQFLCENFNLWKVRAGN
jgi:hypothetical protein